MRIAFVGNHGSAVGLGAEVAAGAVSATTETHWAGSLELLGHEVIRVEEETTPWADRVDIAEDCDLFLWVSTRGFYELWPEEETQRSVTYLNRWMPTAAVHLDRWWGLSNREWQIAESAMFRVGWLFTADGDHQEEWAKADVNHRWLPPAVYGPECVTGTARDEWRSDVGFVGGWQDYGHTEHANYRMSMLDSLRSRFGDRAAFWPRVGESGPWGLAFNDLIASTKVMVGDGWRGANRYFSNRVFECIGRGGFMVHPAIPGLVEMLPAGMGVDYFPPGDWDAMCALVDRWVADDEGRAAAIAKGHAFVRSNHSYERRMQQMLDVMADEGAWGAS